MNERIGVLAVQGNFREHAAMLRRLGARVVEVRKPEQLAELDGLVIPGGESTAILELARLYGLEDAIRRFERPILGTCAGMILLDRDHLGLADLAVERNAYGRQLASFEADLELEGEAEREAKLPSGVFIRAPRVPREREPARTSRCLAESSDRAAPVPRSMTGASSPPHSTRELTDEDAAERLRLALELQIGLEARELAPVRVSLDREIGEAKVIPVEQDHACARAENRPLEAPDRVLEPVEPGESQDRGRLAAGDHEAVELGELFGLSHLDHARPEPPQHSGVLTKVPLHGQDADPLVHRA